jgi:hypothetical protein
MGLHQGSNKKPTRNIFLANARAVTIVSPLSPSMVDTGVVSTRVAGRPLPPGSDIHFWYCRGRGAEWWGV